jgi:hypothetical protein
VNELARLKLVQVVAKWGSAVAENTQKCKGLLGDQLRGECRQEVNVLVQAIQAGVVADLRSSDGKVPVAVLLKRLEKKLHDETGIVENLARWSVESWALALGCITDDQLTPTAQPELLQPLAGSPPSAKEGLRAIVREVLTTGQGSTEKGKARVKAVIRKRSIPSDVANRVIEEMKAEQ